MHGNPALKQMQYPFLQLQLLQVQGWRPTEQPRSMWVNPARLTTSSTGA